MWPGLVCGSFFFFFNDTATTEIYTLSLHDALPISGGGRRWRRWRRTRARIRFGGDRKSTRLNSSHDQISYAVFCLKKKQKDIFGDVPPLHDTPRGSARHDTSRA